MTVTEAEGDKESSGVVSHEDQVYPFSLTAFHVYYHLVCVTLQSALLPPPPPPPPPTTTTTTTTTTHTHTQMWGGWFPLILFFSDRCNFWSFVSSDIFFSRNGATDMLTELTGILILWPPRLPHVGLWSHLFWCYKSLDWLVQVRLRASNKRVLRIIQR